MTPDQESQHHLNQIMYDKSLLGCVLLSDIAEDFLIPSEIHEQ